VTSLGRHVFAGAIATAALELAAPFERTIAGGPLPFAPEPIAAALCRAGHFAAPPRTRARLGTLLRWTYGIGWAVAFGAARAKLPRSHAGRAATLGAAILGVEAVALPPLVGLGVLRGRALAALVLHITLFSAVAEATLSVADRL
jgi:hypothetical protein